MIRPMMNHTLEMVAIQYEEHLREHGRKRLPYDDDTRAPLRRRTARGLRRVADAVDPGEL